MIISAEKIEQKKSSTRLGKLLTVENGIYPIVYDDIGLSIQDGIPGDIQGEGKLVGVPSIFLRLSGCNLKCAWYSKDGYPQLCDAPNSSWKPDNIEMETKKIADTILMNMRSNIKHLVITGGEPMLQAVELTPLLQQIKAEKNVHISLETNGTIFHDEVLEYVDLISISPKLKSSSPDVMSLEDTGVEYNEKRFLRHENFRKNLSVIQAMIDTRFAVLPDRLDKKPGKDFELKFVISNWIDATEIEDEFLPLLRGVQNTDIYLMPLGSDKITLAESSKIAAEEAIKRNWRFSPRLQIK